MTKARASIAAKYNSELDFFKKSLDNPKINMFYPLLEIPNMHNKDNKAKDGKRSSIHMVLKSALSKIFTSYSNV